MARLDIIKENGQFEQLLRVSNTSSILKDECLIPDTHPDVQEILTVDAKPMIKSKEIVGDKVVIEGVVDLTVLYLSREENMGVNSVNYSEKFTNYLELSEGEHKVVCEAECKIEHIDSKIMNERKISIDGVIAVEWEIYKSTGFEFVKDVNAAEKVEVLKKTEPISKLTANEEMELEGKSTVRVGMDKPQVAKVLKCNMNLYRKEVKLAEDKVFLGCYCRINLLYLADDLKEVIPLQDDIYLSKEGECAGVNSSMIPSAIFEISNKDINLEEDDLGENRIINIGIIVKGTIKIFSQENIDVIEDTYCPTILMDIAKKQYEVGLLQGSQNSEVLVKDSISLKEGDVRPEQILSVNGTVIMTDKNVIKDGVVIEGYVKVSVIYKANNDEKYVGAVQGDISFTSPVDIKGIDKGMKAIVKANIENIEAVIEANTIGIKANVALNIRVSNETMKDFVVDVVEIDGEAPKKEASVIIYIVQKRDTLWNLAKKYNTTMNDLIKINNIENPEILVVGEKLIIPGRAKF